MKLSEVKKFCADVVHIVNDCEFDKLYLIGKKKENNKRYLSFVGEPKYVDTFLGYNISAVICTENIAEILKDQYSGGIIVAPNPKKAFFEIHNGIGNPEMEKSETYIDPTAEISDNAIIATENVYIGKNVQVFCNVIIKEGVYIGDNSVVREGSVIGAPAFYYYGDADERNLVRSTGVVRVGSNVELHSNVVVEKGVMYGETLIEDNTKIDNNVVIGHDSIIGRNCTIAGNVILAGGVTLEDNVFLGVSATVSPNIVIKEHSKVSSGAVVTKNVGEREHVSGNFAILHSKYVKHIKDISR